MSEMETLRKDLNFLRGQADAYGDILIQHPKMDDVCEKFQNAVECLKAVQDEIKEQAPDETH